MRCVWKARLGAGATKRACSPSATTIQTVRRFAILHHSSRNKNRYSRLLLRCEGKSELTARLDGRLQPASDRLLQGPDQVDPQLPHLPSQRVERAVLAVQRSCANEPEQRPIFIVEGIRPVPVPLRRHLLAAPHLCKNFARGLLPLAVVEEKGQAGRHTSR